MSVTAAVVNFNGVRLLQPLLQRLERERLDGIVVLDDASTDGSLAVLAGRPGVQVLPSPTNSGPTANRNKMLGHRAGDIILFLDVDMRLLTDPVVAAAERLFASYPRAGVIGGLIRGLDGAPMWFNHGYDPHPARDAQAAAWHDVVLAFWGDERLQQHVRDRAAGVTSNFEEPRERETEWVAEGLMMIRRTAFEELGGFDERFVMGYSGPDLCRRARLRGYEVRFSPSVQAEHLAVDSVGPKLRAAHRRASLAYWYQKHHGVPAELIERFFLPPADRRMP